MNRKLEFFKNYFNERNATFLRKGSAKVKIVSTVGMFFS